MFSNMEKDKKEEHEEVENLNSNLKKLNRNFRIANSFRLTFLRGLVLGLGTTIGATIVAGLVVAFLAASIKTVEDIPFLKDFFEQTQITKIINDSSQNTDTQQNSDTQPEK